MYLKKLALSSALSVALLSLAHAAPPFVVRDIRVEGNQRVEVGTVYSYLPLKIGDTYTEERGAAAIRSLFASGFFRDVRLEVEGDVLVVLVEERPAIAALNFSGAKEFEADKLKSSLRDVGIAESRIFDRALLERAEQELKRLYLSRGLYGVEITSTVTPVERNRVAVDFTIDEGDAAKIREIRIVGNQAFSDRELLKQLQLTTPGWFSRLTKRDQYSRQKLSADIETLRSFYLDRGYLEFKVESTQVAISTDRRDIFITMVVSEGQKFTVSDIKLSGEVFGRQDELMKLIRLKPGQVFNGTKLNESTKAISERMGNYGYAFAEANAIPEIDREKSTVAFNILVDPGRRAYVRRINFVGNERTKDEVIRREFRQLEGAFFDGEKVRRSRDRVDRLGYFEEVNIETPNVPGAPDLVDVNLAVKEKPTGNLSLGAGFSSSDRLILTAGFAQDNIFGTGNRFALQINTSSSDRTLSISQTNPYFTIDGVSQSFDIYTRTFKPNELDLGQYTLKSTGTGLGFGIPIDDFASFQAGLAYENTRIETTPNSPQRYLDYVRNNGSSSSALTAALGWVRDDRNSALAPTKGTLQKLTFDVTVPVLDLRYYRLGAQYQKYLPMTDAFTLAFNGQFDWGRGFSGKKYPLFKNYYAGGIGSVRGYESGSLSQDRDPKDNTPLGGASRLIGNVELIFPFPGVDSRAVRMYTFLDAGNTFPEGKTPDFADLRYSTGIGVSWLSPLGPLRFSYGRPLNAKPNDRKQSLQFQIGTSF
ncbi:MAG: outer membrane protein assembly factor BamA [Burkholderiales bacterium]|nr:outer membrane protein assembly factor BamA [Burkholderiales bacterium]MCA3157759.1 outer membrane protein assembly factor BamA [Burkholderiales bacterium]